MGDSLKAGQILHNGEIEIIDLVGKGGIGEVYRAALHRDGEQKIVAIKCFNPAKMQKLDLGAIELVHRESLVVSRCHHSSIVEIFGINLDPTLPFIIEEYLEGGTLAGILSKRNRQKKAGEAVFGPHEIAHFGLQICGGLMLLHQESQYHGDIKPNNICFRDESYSQVVMVDFGHAGFLEGNVLDRSENLATLAYLPPERAGLVGIAGSASSDLYSLGVTLYEAACGSAPFTGQSSRDLVNSLLYEVPQPLHILVPGFPVALSDIISKLLRKNPRERYHSAFGLAADFERFLLALKAGDEVSCFALATQDKLRELNYHIPMVGRTEEIARLHQMFDWANDEGACVALIGAPSGIGKSRLAFEVLHQARATLSYISHAKFSEYERNLPLSAINVLLLEHAHYLRTRTAVDIQNWQEKVLDKLGPRGRLLADRFPCYDGFFPDFPKFSAEDQTAEIHLFNQSLGEFLALLPASGETQLVLIDDLQWADWQSLQVFGILANAIWGQRTTRIMLMGTYRSNEVTGDHPLRKALLDHCPSPSQIELGPLSRDESDKLIHRLLEEKGPEIAKLQELTYRFTAGNPFYIYEYLKSAIHTGIFSFDEDSKTWLFHEDRIHEANLSMGVAGLVADRIRTLSPMNQSLIALASLAGNAMKRQALLEILPLLLTIRGVAADEKDSRGRSQSIELAYQEFLQKHLLIPDSSSFRFFHDKIQEASYSLLSAAEKVLLHAAYGLWCAADWESIEKRNDESKIFEAAYHICKGDRKSLPLFARKFLVKAATAAQKVYAYDKAKDYLYAVLESLDAQNAVGLDERFEALMTLANTLTISDQISEAMRLYDNLLEFNCTALQKAAIYAKKCEFGLNLFDYKQARFASATGLKFLGTRIMTKEAGSYLYILLFFPILVIYAVFFKYFGRQSKEIETEAEKVRFQLLLKNEISQFSTVPIAAIANIIKLNFELMRYKDSDARTTLFAYWGVAASSFGFSKLGAKFFARSYEYFDRTGNPVDKGFVLFCWGLICDMPSGNLLGAQKKLQEAIRTLAPIGESFWRSVSILGLVLIDYFGGETGEAGIRSHELIELWKRVQFAPTVLGTTLRHYLEEEREEQLAFCLQATLEAELKTRHDGFESVDCIYALLGAGEYYEMRGDYEKAAELLRRATWMGTLGLHRIAYAAYAPIVYTRTLIHQKSYLKALLPLAVCWVNQLLNVRLFLPQTLFVSGYLLDSLGYHKTARRAIEAGINYAGNRHWAAVVAEGRLLWGRLNVDRKAETASGALELAKEYYEVRNWKFHGKLCDQQLNLYRITKDARRTAAHTSPMHTTQSTRHGAGIRQQIEIKSMLGVLLKLSAISDRHRLFETLMEALCQATGSELAILIFEDGESWKPKFGYNISLESAEQLSTKVDAGFLDFHIAAHIQEPAIRLHGDFANGRQPTSGSAMLVPLVCDSQVYGYCYLANTQIYELFDAQSLEIAVPIATQGAIDLQNIKLTDALALEKDDISKLHQTLEQKVVEQTRDIKSIMQHIKMGICTVSGVGISINRDYSLFLEHLFRASDLRDRNLLPLLFAGAHLSDDEKDQVQQTLSASLNEPQFAFEANEHLLPRNLSGAASENESFALELNWVPISSDEEIVDKILLTINDVSALRGIEAQALQKDQELKIVSEILSCSNRDWQLFIGSSRRLVEQNALLVQKVSTDSLTILRKLFANLHTIKGNARSMGCKFMNEVIHEVEQYFSQQIQALDASFELETIDLKLRAVRDVVQKYARIAEERLGRGTNNRETMTLDREILLDWYSIAKELETHDDGNESLNWQSLQDIRDLLFFSVESVLQEIGSHAQKLAIHLGREKVHINIDVPPVWVTDAAEEFLNNTFTHLLRNSLDHGIEPAMDRKVQGKSAEGLIALSGRIVGTNLVLRMEDDGRGLNLAKLREMALARGLLTLNAATNDHLVASLIFTSDFSSAENISDISGRGVGLTAVAQFIREVGGSIEIEFSNRHPILPGFRAFSFVMTLPLSLFQSEAPLPVAC